MDGFGKPAWSYRPAPLSTDWTALGQLDPLSGAGPSAWATQADKLWTYDRPMTPGQSFDPSYSGYVGYDPYSGYTSRMIDSDIQKYLQREFPELYDFDTGNVNTGYGGGGNVSQNPGFGQFAQDPSVFKEIEAAANKYGIPANLLKAVIARESSGDWASNSHSVASVRGGAPIFGYVGVFHDAARSWGFDPATLEGNRAGQIEMLAAGLKGMYDRSPGKKWEEAISMHFSGNWQPSGYTDELGNNDAAYLAQVMAWWQQEDAWTTANGGQVGSGGSATGGMASPNTPNWQGVNKWDSFVAEAATQYGVPANLIKAIMRAESNGDAAIRSPQGATGLMQVMPGMHGLNAVQLLDPRTNVFKGAEILKRNYTQYGSWEMAAKAYLGLGGADAHGTTSDVYWSRVNAYWNELDANASGMFGGAGKPTQAVTSIEAVWGGAKNDDGSPFQVTQEHGPTAFSLDPANRWMYDYSVDLLGTWGHPGIDVGMPIGTRLFAPASGTVVTAGGTPFYTDERFAGAPQTGELRIRLDNGHEVILGHMAGIHVKAGDRINAGQYVGLSGTFNGPHLHLEYRVPDASRNGGWKAVDPREALRGTFSGSFSGNQTGAGIDRPYTFQDLMRAGASGQTIYGGLTVGSGNTWNSWLQKAMRGQIPFGGDTQSWASRDSRYEQDARGNIAPTRNPYMRAGY